jgi:hypothetical protein
VTGKCKVQIEFNTGDCKAQIPSCKAHFQAYGCLQLPEKGIIIIGGVQLITTKIILVCLTKGIVESRFGS